MSGQTTRQRFEQTRDDVKRLHDVQLKIMFDCDDWQPPRIRARNEKSDPTAARACYNVDELSVKLAALRAEETELLERIGLALRIIHGIRRGLGDKYADVIELRYIDGMKWKDIAKDYEIPRSTGHELISVACDWVDSIGLTKLLECDYEL